MEHPDPAPVQESSQPMGQPEDPPDETTEEAVQTTLPTAYGGYCLQGCGARCGIKVDWGGTRMQKQREEGPVTRLDRLPISTISHVACLIASFLIKLHFCFPGWQGAPFHKHAHAQRSKRQQMKRWPQSLQCQKLGRCACKQRVGVRVGAHNH